MNVTCFKTTSFAAFLSKKTKLFLVLLLVANLFFASSVFGQTVGDYRSNVNTTGNWTVASNWQVCTSVSPSINWVSATNYPGQVAGTYAVLIQAGDIITIGVTGIVTQAMGSLTISGSLVLNGINTGSVGTNYIFETQTIIVTPLLGTIDFNDKVNLKLPTNATLQVIEDTTPNPDYYGLIGDCNHNQDIYIGTNVYAYCNGGGSTGLTFIEVMTGGGTLNTIATSNSPICQGNTINLFGSYSGVIGSVVTYSWSITNPNNIVTTTSTQNPIISNAVSGIYTATLTCSTTYESKVYSNSESITVTVNVLLSTPTISSYTLPTFTNNDGTITLDNLPAGPWVGNQIKDGVTVSTISGSGTPHTIKGLSTGSYEFEVVGLCPSLTASPTQLVPYVPAVSSATNINCTGFTANWPATPLADSYLLDVSTDINFATFVSGYQNRNVGNVLTFPVTGMSGGTLYYRIRAQKGTLQTLYSAPITVAPLINIFSGPGSGSWSLGTPPPINGTQNLVINAVFTSTADLSGCSCEVKAGVTVNINSGHTLTLTNGLTVDTLGFGEITFFDDASLVQINDVENEGDINYQRITEARKTDYTYWSSPVTSMNLGDLYFPYTSNGTFYSYEATAAGEDWSPFDAGAEMVAGKGYIANQGAEIPTGVTPPSDELDVTFSGIPNNGHYEINGIFADKSYLLGNPYPSALDADTLLAANSSVLDGTLYFWTHNTAFDLNGNLSTPDPAGWVYAYTSDDYASYNITGGVGVSAPSDPGHPVNIGDADNGKKPTGKISSGQGFFASSKAGIPLDSKIVFENTMRVGVIDILEEDNTQFFKKRGSKTEKVIEKNRIWLNLTNTQGAFKQTLIGYVTDATNDYDSRFDGESFDGNEFVDFYSLNQDKNLTIQGRALPFDENDEVPLGYRTTINGAFTINIDQVDGSLTNQAVYIEDKLTNTITDLKSGNYTFNTVAGTFDDRFVLRYTNKTLGKEEVELNDGIIALYSNNNKTLIIRNNVNDATVNAVELFNLLGQSISNWDVNDNDQTNIQIPIKNADSGIYIVKIKTTKGEFSKKIIIK